MTFQRVSATIRLQAPETWPHFHAAKIGDPALVLRNCLVHVNVESIQCRNTARGEQKTG